MENIHIFKIDQVGELAKNSKLIQPLIHLVHFFFLNGSVSHSINHYSN